MTQYSQSYQIYVRGFMYVLSMYPKWFIGVSSSLILEQNVYFYFLLWVILRGLTLSFVTFILTYIFHRPLMKTIPFGRGGGRLRLLRVEE